MNGNVYFTDSGNDRIDEYTEGGAFVTQWGSLGAAAGKFNNPSAIAIAPNGNNYVADSYNYRIQEFYSLS